MIAFDSKGNYYIADTQNYVIREVNTAGVINHGRGHRARSATRATAARLPSANLSLVQGLAVDSKGNIYIARQR